LKISFKTKETFLKIWRDPVWSNVIAGSFIIAIPVVLAKITHHTWGEIYQFLKTILSFELPVYFFLSVIGLYFIVQLCRQIFIKKKDPLWDEQIGNYTFKQLYNILLTQTFPVRTDGMVMTGRQPPSGDLLYLFRLYYLHLNKGVDIEDNTDDGGYLYSIFAPKMVGFGLVDEYQKPDVNLPNVTDTAYKTSALGHKFHASLEKVMLDNRMKEMKKNKKV